MKKSIAIAMASLLIVSSSAFSAEIKIAGGAAPMNNIFKRIKDAFEKKTKHTLVLTEQSPELALQSLEKGEIQVASAGLAWPDWLKLCKEKNIVIDESKPFRNASVGKDGINIFVNKNSSLKKLEFAEIEKIFTGAATNWKEFGGPDKPIKVVISPNIAGTNKFFKKTAMGGAEYKKDTVKAENATDIVKIIGSDVDTIGFGPAGVDTEANGVRIVDAPAFFRPILFVFLSSEPYIIDLKNFIASAEGQALIKR